MTIRGHSNGHNPQPPREAEVIDFNKASREHPQKTDVPVEVYLLSDEGRADMDKLYETIDSSGSIIKTLAFHVLETRKRMEVDEDPTIYALFLHDDGTQALTRPELIDLYKTNPLLNATLRAVQRKHHDGDFHAKHLYTFGLRVFMNMVRYEWLTRTYDPSDPAWEERAMRLGDYRGREMRVNLQPGHNRQTIIQRHNTPSDYLEHINEA